MQSEIVDSNMCLGCAPRCLQIGTVFDITDMKKAQGSEMEHIMLKKALEDVSDKHALRNLPMSSRGTVLDCAAFDYDSQNCAAALLRPIDCSYDSALNTPRDSCHLLSHLAASACPHH